jgi:ribosomal protein L11 methylase PrmA
MSTATQDLITAGFGLFLLLSFFVFFIAGFFRSPFVPSNRKTIEKMLKVAKIKKGEKVFDLGCGDGRIIIRAEKEFGAKATGFEVSILVWLLAQANRLLKFSKVKIFRRNFFQVDLRKADVIFCYLLPEAMKKLSPKFKKELKPGARVVSAAFHLPGWKITKEYKKTTGTTAVFVYQKNR